MISIVILTLNEEKDLPACLDSVKWSNDIHIIDSGSTDKTVAIAQEKNATISYNKFESFGKQRNFALNKGDIKNDWILFLDADEIVTDKFHDALITSINSAGTQVAGFYCCWKMILDNQWLKRCDNFPKWQFRLLKKGMAKFTDLGHGQKEGEVNGEINYIKEPYVHYGFSKGWYHWFERHNKYSSQEAISRFSNPQQLKQIFSKHGSIRNPALKYWLSKLPGWPAARFIFSYFFKMGFLEGRAGLLYCVNISYYEYLIQIKMRELKKVSNNSIYNPS